MTFSSFRCCHLTSVHSLNDVRIQHKECASLAAAGFEVHLVVPGAPDGKYAGVHVHGVSKSSGSKIARMTKTVYCVYKKAVSVKAELYHFHDPELLPVGLLLKLSGKKVIYDSHEDLPRQLLSKPWIPASIRKPLSLMLELVENTIARKLDAVVTATPHIEERFKKAGCRAMVINNFPRIEEFDVIDSPWDDKEKAVCYAGGITAIRGITEMVSAVGLTDAKLLLAGSFSPPTLRASVSQLPGWESVEEFGLLERKAMVKLLGRSCAGLVLFHPEPNHTDAQPNKIFEYMAAGLPVIASNFPLWRQIIERNDCGICVDPLNPDEIAEAITRLVDHPEIVRRMGENGRRAVHEHFTWEREGEKLLSLYLRLLQSDESPA